MLLHYSAGDRNYLPSQPWLVKLRAAQALAVAGLFPEMPILFLGPADQRFATLHLAPDKQVDLQQVSAAIQFLLDKLNRTISH